MTSAVPLDSDGLVAYLTACGGHDTFVLWREDGQPDLVSARELAENLRVMLGPKLGTLAAVDQSFNRVTLSLLLEAARI